MSDRVTDQISKRLARYVLDDVNKTQLLMAGVIRGSRIYGGGKVYGPEYKDFPCDNCEVLWQNHGLSFACFKYEPMDNMRYVTWVKQGRKEGKRAWESLVIGGQRGKRKRKKGA